MAAIFVLAWARESCFEVKSENTVELKEIPLTGLLYFNLDVNIQKEQGWHMGLPIVIHCSHEGLSFWGFHPPLHPNHPVSLGPRATATSKESPTKPTARECQ